jgi:hypothetical protein
MDTHLLIGVAVMLGLIGIAASRDLLRNLRAQPQLIRLLPPPLSVGSREWCAAGGARSASCSR